MTGNSEKSIVETCQKWSQKWCKKMDSNGLQVLVGYLCTSIFMLSRVPMLLKAIHTRDLRSYSPAHLLMSTCANLLFWIYVVGLPIGPVWILQIFFTITDVTMLALCVTQLRQLSRQEKNKTTNHGLLLGSSTLSSRAQSLSIPKAIHIKAME